MTLKGSYILVLDLREEREITVGKLGAILFSAGFYAYVGSAMGRLEPRIARHIGKTKRLHWHIDYLLQAASVEEAIFAESTTRTECVIARALASSLVSVPRFGCSDCNCPTHLYFSPHKSTILSAVEEAFHRAGLSPQRWSDLLVSWQDKGGTLESLG
jgi:Uri superfamily endonuclease